MAIIGLALLVSAVTAGIAYAVHMFRISVRDSFDLAAKLAVPHPRRAADWPELRLDEVVFDPGFAERILVRARWPAHPEFRALLVLEVLDAPERARRLLVEWRDTDASLSPCADAESALVLRRRRTNHVVDARVIRETSWIEDEGPSYARK
ncbi:MAG TPA: hypothetical protein VHP57_11155 [Acidimicrobiia bacterium]|jgi:hypothetical protein|nr:hypothetical protein [Acidimicrobiia bacterium]